MYVEVILGSALTTLLSYYMYLLQRWRIFQTFKKLGIPGPPPSLLLGNLKDIQTYGRHVMLERWNRKYGDFYGFYEGPQPVIVTSDLEVVKKVCISDHHTYNQRKPPLFASEKDPYMNMFLASGSKWQRLRNISSPAFTGKQMKAMSPLVSRCVDHVMDILETKCEKEVDFNVYELFQCLTLDTIARCAFGMEICSVKEEDNIFLSKCRAMFNNVQEKNSGFKYILALITAFPSTIHIGRLLAKLFGLSVREWFLTSVKMIIESRQKAPSKENDLIQLMLNAEEVNPEDNGGGELERSKAEVNTRDNRGNGTGSARKQNNKMTIPEIQGQCFLFLVAGYETTSTLLAFVAYRLVIHPELQEKIYTEIKQHFDDKCNPDYESSKKCVYLGMFINETLRMHPLAAIIVNRYSCEKSVIKGHNIPKCTQVQIDVSSIHYNSEHWPEPDVFDPERFTPELKASRDTSAFLQFGAGPRICIGTRFAMMETKITLIRILHRYRFTKSPTMSVPIVESNNGIKGPTEGVQVIVYPRC